MAFGAIPPPPPPPLHVSLTSSCFLAFSHAFSQIERLGGIAIHKASDIFAKIRYGEQAWFMEAAPDQPDPNTVLFNHILDLVVSEQVGCSSPPSSSAYSQRYHRSQLVRCGCRKVQPLSSPLLRSNSGNSQSDVCDSSRVGSSRCLQSSQYMVAVNFYDRAHRNAFLGCAFVRVRDHLVCATSRICRVRTGHLVLLVIVFP